MSQDDVSGDYKEILLAMIGERPPPAPVAEEEDAGEPELEEVEEEHIEVWVLLYDNCKLILKFTSNFTLLGWLSALDSRLKLNNQLQISLFCST